MEKIVKIHAIEVGDVVKVDGMLLTVTKREIMPHNAGIEIAAKSDKHRFIRQVGMSDNATIICVR